MKKAKTYLIRRVIIAIIVSVLAGCTGLNSTLPAIDERLNPSPTITEYTTLTPASSTITDRPSLTPSPTIGLEQITKEAGNSLWTTKENWFLANQIRVVFIDDSGDLWTGGPDGVVHWDTKNGSNTIFVAGDKTHGSQVTGITQTSDQAIWVSTFGNGVSRYDVNDQWETFTTANGLPSNYIGNILASTNGNVWINTSIMARDLADPKLSGEIGQFDGQHWYQWINGEGGGFYQVVSAPNSELWLLIYPTNAPHLKGIGRIYGSSWETIAISDAPTKATAITVASNGEFWVAAETAVFRYDGEKWDKILPPWIGKTYAKVSDIEVIPSGEVWFGFSVASGINGERCGERGVEDAEFGVYRYDGNNWIHYTTNDGLVDNKICDITSDKNGNVWIGSFDKGISRFDGKTWTSFVIP